MSSTTHTSGLVRQSLPKGLRALIWVVRGLTLLGAFALCVVPVAFWCSPGWVAEDGPALASLHGHPVVIDARARLLGAVASAPGVALGLAALAQLWALFSEYDAGRVFGVAAVRHMGRFAWFMLASALLVPLQRAAIGVALTLGNPAGQRVLVLGINWNDYVAILCTAVLLAITAVMTEAARLAEENASFI